MKKAVFLLILAVMLVTSLVTVGCGLKAAPTIAPTTTPTQEVYRLKHATFDLESSVFERTAMKPWRLLITKETGGRVVFDEFFSESLCGRADMQCAPPKREVRKL